MKVYMLVRQFMDGVTTERGERKTVRNAFSLKCMQVPPAFFTGFDFSPTLYDNQFIASRVVLTASKLQFQFLRLLVMYSVS